jgi:hypothetical protein
MKSNTNTKSTQSERMITDEVVDYLDLDNTAQLYNWRRLRMGPEAYSLMGKTGKHTRAYYLRSEVVLFGIQSGLRPLREGEAAPAPTKIYRWQADATLQSVFSPHLREVATTTAKG